MFTAHDLEAALTCAVLGALVITFIYWRRRAG